MGIGTATQVVQLLVGLGSFELDPCMLQLLLLLGFSGFGAVICLPICVRRYVAICWRGQTLSRGRLGSLPSMSPS